MIPVITTNPGKFKEIERVLQECGIPAIQEPLELQEEGRSLEEVARFKAEQAWAALKKPLIVEDTGLFFTAFENFPGTRTKRTFQEIGYEGILAKLEGKNQEAYFQSVIAYVDDQGIRLFSGRLEGSIANELSPTLGNPALPMNRIFVPKGWDRALIDTPLEEEGWNSHRAQATKKFAAFFKQKQ